MILPKENMSAFQGVRQSNNVPYNNRFIFLNILSYHSNKLPYYRKVIFLQYCNRIKVAIQWLKDNFFVHPFSGLFVKGFLTGVGFYGIASVVVGIEDATVLHKNNFIVSRTYDICTKDTKAAVRNSGLHRVAFGLDNEHVSV